MDSQAPMQIQQQNTVTVNAAEFASKFQSKREIFRFLHSECSIYLPPYEVVTIFSLRYIAT